MFREENLHPPLFLISCLISFLLCVLLGHIVSQFAYFHNFLRFHHAISPSFQYYPTIHEILNTAKKQASIDKLLVVIAGNSTFRGAGQEENNLWTIHLQKLLGSDYNVLNVANDGAETPSFGGVVFRILSETYPKILLATTLRWGNIASKDGVQTYNYLFWDAYYKRLIHTDKDEENIIKNLRLQQLNTYSGLETHILGMLDSQLYFRNLWNWIGYNFIFTVWTEKSFKPRKYVSSKEIGWEYMEKQFFKKRKLFFIEKETVESYIEKLINVKDPTTFYKTQLIHIENRIKEIFPKKLHKNILFVLIRENGWMLSQINQSYLPAAEIALQSIKEVIQRQGYHVIDVKNLKKNDYVDSIHPNASGGIKVAKAVALQIKNLTKDK